MTSAASVADDVPTRIAASASPKAAWAFTALGVLGAVWVTGYLRTVIQRPVLVCPDAVHVRSGIQWSVRIPFDAIAQLEVGRVKSPAKEASDALRAVKFGTPNALLTLREPQRATGMYGKQRDVSVVALTLDDRAGFERAVNERLSARARAVAPAG